MKRTKTSHRRFSALIGVTAVAAAAGVGLAVLPALPDGGGDGAGRGSGNQAGPAGVDRAGYAGRGDGGRASHAGHGDAGSAVIAEGTGERTSSTATALFVASLDGANEVPVKGGPAVDDRDGQALQFVKVQGDRVSVAVKFRGTDRPTALHIHQGARGTNGGVKIDFTGLLARGGGELKGWTGTVTGAVRVKDKALLKKFTAGPNGFYANLHTARFPGGAVRGQFHRVNTAFPFDRALHNFQASVVRGKQIYQCKKAKGGGYSFQQRDVSAVLGGAISHSFVAPNSGAPRWVAADRSAVTGKLLRSVPNGRKNIAELHLKAEQAGKKKGRLATVREIFRLNTTGGVAPAGRCAKGAVTGVSYGADYVFVQK
ncbi:CHRD domain-containing protein [Streptomyces sp. NPDC014894]|uniref:CHRD domain-containing protein n=1 Tax=unclassified Streptomyces TaxID=2593676 RepID=UPI0036FEEDE4